MSKHPTKQRRVELRFPVGPWMGRQEVADYLRCHPNSVDKLAREGLLTKHHIHGLNSLLYSRREVEGLVLVEAPRKDMSDEERREALSTALDEEGS